MAVQVKKRYRLEDFSLDPNRRLLLRAGEPIHLAQRPFQVLVYLIENRERLVSRAELLDLFWDGKDVYDVTLTKCIGAIRKALDDRQESPRFIETRYAEGYRYIGPVEEEIEPSELSLVEVEKTRAVRVVVEETVSFQGPEDEEAIATQLPVQTLAQMKPKLTRRAVAFGLAIAIIAVLAAGLILYRRRALPGEAKSSLIRSIAVLPLRNLSGDPAQEYFSDGVTESLITELSRIEGLKVISRSSVFTFKGKEVDPRQVGKQLGVAAVLEGSARKSGETVRVDVRLVSTDDGSVLWAGDSYNRALKDILAVQDEITCSITSGLRIRLCGEGQPTAKRYTNNVDAYQAYLKGRYYMSKRTNEGLKKAIEHFEQAIRLDSNYALAYAGLVECFKLGVWYMPMPASEAVPKMKAAAMRAIELDDSLAESHLAISEVYSFEWRWLDTLRESERALDLNPGYANAHHGHSLGVALIGRLEKAIAESKRALELDPLSLIINTDAGWVYYLARRYDEAIEQYKKTLEMDPNFTLARFDLALAYSEKGMHEEAIEEMLKASDRGSEYLAGLGYVYAVADRQADALEALERLKQLSRRQYVPPYHFAWVYTGLGQKDQAIAMLEKVYEEHTQHVVDFKMHPMFDPLRSDPRYQDLLRRVGLPD